MLLKKRSGTIVYDQMTHYTPYHEDTLQGAFSRWLIKSQDFFYIEREDCILLLPKIFDTVNLLIKIMLYFDIVWYRMIFNLSLS